MSWSTVKTRGVVLRVDPFREADRRYRMLTREHGKLSFVGRGAQKGKAKLAAHLEPFAVVDVEIVRGRRSTTVISVERVQVFRNIAQSLDSRLLAQSSLLLLDRYTREMDDDAPLYDELLTWLAFLDAQNNMAPARRTLALCGFLLRCMVHMGYEVALDDCVACKQQIMPLAFRWHGGKGGLVCSDCINSDREEWFAARTMPEEVVKLIRFARSTDYEQMLRPALAGAHVEELANVMHDLLTYHLPGDYEVPFWAGIMADYALEVPEQSM